MRFTALLCALSFSAALPASPQEQSKDASSAALHGRAVEHVRTLFESKTRQCGDSLFARMGPYAVNEYKDVRYRVIPSPEQPAVDTVRVQMLASLRQYWANDGKWRPWAQDQIVLDLNVIRDHSGALHTQPGAGADTSGEDLRPISCVEIPAPAPPDATH